jgi:hypothetical protein
MGCYTSRPGNSYGRFERSSVVFSLKVIKDLRSLATPLREPQESLYSGGVNEVTVKK